MKTTALESGYVKSFDGTPIYYEARGEGEPIILVYGIACLINHWHHQIEYFSQTHKVIAFDLRGHHKSQPIADMRNLKMKHLAKDIQCLLEGLNLQSAHFMGHSFGAPLLLEVFDLHPQMVKSMVFINGFSKNPVKGMFGLNAVESIYKVVSQQYNNHPDLWKSLWKVAVDNPLSMILAGAVGGFNLRLSEFKDIEVYARGVSRMDLKIFLDLFEELMNFNGDIILPKVNIPTMIISGEKDNVTPQKFQHDFHDAIVGSEFVLVPYGSHCTQLDFPDFINLKILDFYKRHFS
ncbi:MAG: alpha/beta fold hydrolase [Bdellovibrionia bacterium]